MLPSKSEVSLAIPEALMSMFPALRPQPGPNARLGGLILEAWRAKKTAQIAVSMATTATAYNQIGQAQMGTMKGIMTYSSDIATTLALNATRVRVAEADAFLKEIQVAFDKEKLEKAKWETKREELNYMAELRAFEAA